MFEAAGIPALPFKGVVLGASVYGDMTARTAGDLDVLIYYRDLLPATRILKERGYELKTKVLEDGSPEAENHFEYHFERAEDGMVLELRWRLELTQPRYKRNLGMDWVWPRRRTTRLAGAEVPNFDAISELLMLCMHGSKHVWSRLIWTCDVAKLMKSEPGLDWSFAIRESRRLGLWRCLALGVLLARDLTGVQVPAEALRSFEKDRTVRNLASFLQEHVPCEPGKVPDGRVPYEVQLLGFRERSRRGLLADIFTAKCPRSGLCEASKSVGALVLLDSSVPVAPGPHGTLIVRSHPKIYPVDNTKLGNIYMIQVLCGQLCLLKTSIKNIASLTIYLTYHFSNRWSPVWPVSCNTLGREHELRGPKIVLTGLLRANAYHCCFASLLEQRRTVLPNDRLLTSSRDLK